MKEHEGSTVYCDMFLFKMRQAEERIAFLRAELSRYSSSNDQSTIRVIYAQQKTIQMLLELTFFQANFNSLLLAKNFQLADEADIQNSVTAANSLFSECTLFFSEIKSLLE